MSHTPGALTLAAALLLGTIAGAPAQEPRTAVFEPSPTVTAALTVGKAEILVLPRAAAEILVSDPTVADVQLASPTRLYFIGRGVGNTNVFVIDGRGQVISRLELNVRIDDATLSRTLQAVLPSERLGVETVNGDVLLTGTVSSPAAALRARSVARRFVAGDENLVDLMRVAGDRQVLLRVRIVEAERRWLNELGVSTAFNAFRRDGGGGVAEFATDQLAGLTAAPFASGGLFLQPDGFGPLSVTIDALATNGQARILAEPNLTAVSGETASFLAGGEFPVPQGEDDGEVSIGFKSFGVSLAFTPTVLDENRISLRLGTEVSSLSDEGAIQLAAIRVPSLSVRRAETTVELGSGGTLMIAGLLQANDVDGVSGIPGISDIPVIGELARSRSFARNESELLIVVTAVLVQPYAAEQAGRATVAPVTPPTQLGLIDGLRSVYGDAVPADAGRGAVGYLVD